MKIHENMNSKVDVSGNGPCVTRQCRCRLKAKFVGKTGNPRNVPKGDTCRARQIYCFDGGKDRKSADAMIGLHSHVECQSYTTRENFLVMPDGIAAVVASYKYPRIKV